VTGSGLSHNKFGVYESFAITEHGREVYEAMGDALSARVAIVDPSE